MSLKFAEAVKVLEEHIEILKHNLLFLMAERKPESTDDSNQQNQERTG